jgi:hypothetical protein
MTSSSSRVGVYPGPLPECPAANLFAATPLPGVVRRWSQSLAVLDAVMSAEREYRYYSFDAQFRPGQAVASMDNGSGDEYSITFTGDGAFLRGFDHESPLSPFGQTPLALWPGLLTGLPAPLAAPAREPAFTLEGVPGVEHRRAASLERVLFHLLQEYARHLGHLDIVSELADGQIGE